MITRISGEHNHDSDLMKEAVKEKVAEKIKSAVENPTLTPRTVFMDLTNSVLSDPLTASGLPNLPNMRSMARSIQMKRKSLLGSPSLPKTWDDMIVPEEYTITLDGEEFLILDEHLPGKISKVWGWASDSGLAILKAASDIYGDGTFKICKYTMFPQAWILVAKSIPNNVTLPCAFFLLPDTQYLTYCLVLNKLKELGVPGPNFFHLDFEAAAIKAVRAVFPETDIECCDTHWKQCLCTHQKEIGLVTHLNDDIVIQQFCRKLWALSFVPKEDVIKVYTDTILPTLPVVDEEDDANVCVTYIVKVPIF